MRVSVSTRTASSTVKKQSIKAPAAKKPHAPKVSVKGKAAHAKGASSEPFKGPAEHKAEMDLKKKPHAPFTQKGK